VENEIKALEKNSKKHTRELDAVISALNQQCSDELKGKEGQEAQRKRNGTLLTLFVN
jgi:hypothetical protein